MVGESDLKALYDRVDRATARLSNLHRTRLACRRGCASCCVDGLTVFSIEADNIRHSHAELLQTGEPHPPGACAFLDAAGACRIYPERPYVCRTQGLPLRWVEAELGVEHRDICPLNAEGPPLVQLPADACWTIGPFEAELAALEVDRLGRWPEPEERIPLRSLWSR